MTKELVDRVEKAFVKCFNSDPLMVFSPGRINLIGEHTDYNNGFVLPGAIDKGIVCAISKSSSSLCTIKALDLDETYEFKIDEIKPIDNGNWINYALGIVDELKKLGKTLKNFNIAFGGNIPLGSGLSSSAALENSIVFAINELFQLKLTKQEMIHVSQNAEHNFVGVKCGIMDQYASMFGVKNSVLQLDCEDLSSKLIQLDLKEYSLLLINTNVTHSLSDSAYNNRRQVCENIADKLEKESLRDVSITNLNSLKDEVSNEDFNKALYVLQENKRVKDACLAINNNDLITLGNLLFASHAGLKDMYQVSCKELDFLVEYAKENQHVLGARMMGGGFGGCTINIVKTNSIKNIKQDVSKKYKDEFSIDCSFYNVRLEKGTRLLQKT